MAKPKNLIPSVEKKISIEADLCARMELSLYSELEGRIPYGAQSQLINQLLRQHYREVDARETEF